MKYPTPFADLPDGSEGSSSQGVTDPSPGGWDGWIHLLQTPKTLPPWFPTGLLPQATALFQGWGLRVQVDDRRRRPEPGLPEPADLQLYDYQEDAVAAGVRVGYGVFDMPPRSGKTRINVELSRRLAVPGVYLAPTDGIVTQTLGVFDRFMGKNYARHLVGSDWKAIRNVPMVLCTAATAGLLPDEFWETRGALFVDEFHHASAISYKDIFRKCKHVYHRFGFTGTFYRSGTDAMAMHALLSTVIYRVTAQQMLERGRLVPLDVVFCPVATKHLRGLPSKTFTTGHGKFGIHDNEDRNALVVRFALGLASRGHQVLVLVGTKAQGRWIEDNLNRDLGLLGSRRLVEYVHSDRPREGCREALARFEGGSCKVLVGTSLLGEGIDLPSASALVYARGEKAAVSLRQYSYRVCTASEGKTRAILVDFADRHHRKLLKHAQERLRLFYEEPICSVRVAQSETEAWSFIPPRG